MPKVSVIVLSYNHEKFITQTIESVLNQTFQDFEIIVVDDCSTDNSVAAIKKIHDPRIKLFVHSKNQGCYATHNDAIGKASGEYTSLINSDDIWEKDKLAKQLAYFDKHSNIDVVLTKVTLIDDDGNTLQSNEPNIFDVKNRTSAEWLNRFFTTGNCLCHPSSMFRKKVYDEVGLYQKNFGLLGDFDMWTRVCQKHEIHILDEHLIKFRLLQNGQNASSENIYNYSRNYFEYQKVLNNFLQITNIERFMAIFPEAKKYGQVTLDTIPYFLARIALDITYNVHNLWGLNTLYDFISQKNNIKILEDRFNFSNVDFVKLTKKYDLLNLAIIQNKNTEIQAKDTVIQDLNTKIQKLNTQLQTTLNTISWKITKPLRLISRILKKTQ